VFEQIAMATAQRTGEPHAAETVGKRLTAAAGVIGLWTIPGVMYSLETAYSWRLEGIGEPVWRAALYQMPGWYVWAVLMYPLMRLARAFPLSRGRWLRSVPVHALACFAVAVCYASVKSTMARWALPGLVQGGFFERVVNQLAQWLPATVITYAGVLAVTAAIGHARTAQQRDLQAAQLTAELSRAQLAALRAQIHPHFVFNTLHTVAAIVRARDPEKAVAVLASLAEILRDTFRGAPDREVPLREELAWIARYLAIQQARFADRVEIAWSVGDGTLDALVPQMVLQPLVENAFRHGVARRDTVAHIELSAGRAGDRLELCVRDDGPPFDATPAAAESSQIGLASTRARLALLYAGAAQLTLARTAEGTVATVALPFHLAPPAGPAASPA
jgi:signal transduction histidine kinase